MIDDDGNHHFEPSELGRRLEAEHGPILWLHPDNTDGADRFHIALVPRPAR